MVVDHVRLGAVMVMGPLVAVIAAQELGAVNVRQSIDPTLLAAAIVTVLSSLGGMVVLVINALAAKSERALAAAERKALLVQTVEVARKADVIVDNTGKIDAGSKETAKKLDEVNAKADKIETSTNSAASKSVEKIDGLEKHIVLLTQMLVKQDQAAAILAQAKATTEAVAAAVSKTESPADAPVLAAAHLEEIEQHTKDTAVNTAKTEAVVQDLKQKQ